MDHSWKSSGLRVHHCTAICAKLVYHLWLSQEGTRVLEPSVSVSLVFDFVAAKSGWPNPTRKPVSCSKWRELELIITVSPGTKVDKQGSWWMVSFLQVVAPELNLTSIRRSKARAGCRWLSSRLLAIQLQVASCKGRAWRMQLDWLDANSHSEHATVPSSLLRTRQHISVIAHGKKWVPPSVSVLFSPDTLKLVPEKTGFQHIRYENCASCAQISSEKKRDLISLVSGGGTSWQIMAVTTLSSIPSLATNSNEVVTARQNTGERSWMDQPLLDGVIMNMSFSPVESHRQQMELGKGPVAHSRRCGSGLLCEWRIYVCKAKLLPMLQCTMVICGWGRERWWQNPKVKNRLFCLKWSEFLLWKTWDNHWTVAVGKGGVGW